MKHSPVFVVLLALLLGGCASAGIKKGEYFKRLGSVELGISKTEFRALFPESVPRGAKQYPNGAVEVLELSYQTYAFLPTGRERNELTGMEAQPQWFYFYNGKLIQFGNPNDWPSDPDIVIETRRR
jgi:hypothetical protein